MYIVSSAILGQATASPLLAVACYFVASYFIYNTHHSTYHKLHLDKMVDTLTSVAHTCLRVVMKIYMYTPHTAPRVTVSISYGRTNTGAPAVVPL